MRQADWAARAEADLARMIAWFGPIDADIAGRLSAAIVSRADWLCDFPMVGSPIGRSQRKALVPGTGYLIVYRPLRSGIYVLRIHHQHENWRR